MLPAPSRQRPVAGPPGGGQNAPLHGGLTWHWNDSKSLRAKPFAGGKSFGEAGAYERVDGIAHFALDPGSPANSEIVDLALAERAADGLVRFNSDFTILRPVDGGARRLLIDIPNRGSKPAVTFLNRAERSLVPVVEIDPGDGFLYERGWTVAWVGWQWDIADHPALVGMRAPEAKLDGKPLPGMHRLEITCAVRRDYAGLRDETLGPSINQPYPAADLDDPGATLTVQDVQDGPAHRDSPRAVAIRPRR